MAQGTARWTDGVRPLPGGWVVKVLLVVVPIAFMASDISQGDVTLTGPRGWFELIFPYTPVFALLAGAAAGAATWLVVFAVVLSMGAPLLLVSATWFPMMITVGLATFALPKVAAWAFSAIALALVPLMWLVNPDAATAVLVFTILGVSAAAAGLGTSTVLARSERDAQKVRQLRQKQTQIRNQERIQLAHELHDIVAHDMTIIAMQAQRAEIVNNPDTTAQILESIGGSASQALQDLRSLVTLLKTDEQNHQPAGDGTETREHAADLLGVPQRSGETITAAGLLHDIRNVADALERAGFRLQLDVEGSLATVPTSVRHVVRRTVREMGTNILKHGDINAPARLRLVIADDHVALSTVNGTSAAAPVASSQTGLEAMRARCEVFGGRVHTESTAGTWSTTMTIPLEGRKTPETVRGVLR
ncbi:sensor histidine kinase [Microbacterium sp.]|uniref:sensor histidine kinase n=1 Tax=Microbacterium sp. TaxID=51671 RepID=UPI003A845960